MAETTLREYHFPRELATRTFASGKPVQEHLADDTATLPMDDPF